MKNQLLREIADFALAYSIECDDEWAADISNIANKVLRKERISVSELKDLHSFAVEFECFYW